MSNGSVKTNFETAFDRAKGCNSVQEAITFIQQNYAVDYVTYHLAQTVSGTFDAPFVRTTYPPEWVSCYLLKNYIQTDPIIREGFERQMPFDWREVTIPPSAQTFFEDAKLHNIGDKGYSIPVRDKGNRRALLSFSTAASEDIWDITLAANRDAWIELAHLVHKKAVLELHGGTDPIPVLGRREIECLYWSALGKDHKSVARILGISQHTARGYIKSARYKLGCSSISAAVSLATKLRIINPNIVPANEGTHMR
ncbi:autoinducer binding domain-containing protein [Rhizobium sp. CFBP 8762]|uniref:helix-turn-helix transcriptional regulator n=1 Tax=Rhizobium sp. CFBP 8762 TaxID=2775279 RepID=UPI0017810570|nr:autoinducer binding domain-containing protein [Rhizobium sp. CFBP 8762]MBD8555580.1 autoinducer binding domain-containing protein [Rhizobium sp. CFBP 8762]